MENVDENIILSDKNLLKYMEEEKIKTMAELFSNGKFGELINTFFKRNKLKNNESINIQTLQQFLNDDISNRNRNISQKAKAFNFRPDYNVINNIYNNDDSDRINDASSLYKNDNVISETEVERGILKNLTFNLRGSNLDHYNFKLKTPEKKDNDVNNIMNFFKIDNNKNMIDNRITHSSSKFISSYSGNIIDNNYFNNTIDDKEYDYSLLNNFADDQLTQQILLTIVIYCLMKIKEFNEIKSLLVQYSLPNNRTIFPLILLKSKFDFKMNEITKSLNTYAEAITNYNIFKSKNNNNANNNDIIYIETYKQDFVYFNNLFNYLFALNNIDSKIKKLYYEQKFCLYYLNFYSQGFKLLIELYNKYPDDPQIQFELAKDSVYLSKYDVFQEIFQLLQKETNEEKDENKKMIYRNYIYYVKCLSLISQGKYEDASKYSNELLQNDSSNVVLINNNALLNIYQNKSIESYNNMNLILSPDQMDSHNEAIQENINILIKKFNANSQKTY